jgi:DNA gyrase/topoisomerase IV subunit A
LRKAKERAHILEGLIIASDNIDEVIKIIRAAKTPNDAISGLMERFQLSEIQSRAIVEMRLRQLTGLSCTPNMRKFRSRLLIWKKSLSMTNSAAKSLKMN